MQILFSNKGLLAARIGEAGTEDFCRQLLSISERGGQSLVLEERTPEMQSQASSLRNTAINLSEVSLLICWYNLSSGLTVSLVIKLHCLCYLFIQKEQSLRALLRSPYHFTADMPAVSNILALY